MKSCEIMSHGIAVVVVLLAITYRGAADGLTTASGPMGTPAWSFLEPVTTPPGEPPWHVAVIRNRWAMSDAGVLDQVMVDDEVAFELFDDASFTGTVERRAETGPGRFTLTGSLLSTPGGNFTIGVNGTAVVATLRGGERGTFRIRHSLEGLSIVEQIDVAALPYCAGAETPDLVPADDDGNGDGDEGGGGVAGGDEIAFVDVLVVYTPAVSGAAGGVFGIEAEIDVMMEDANVAFENTLAPVRVNLVYVSEIDYNESSNHLAVLTDPNDGIMDEVHTLRNAYGADLVALIRTGGGGSAWGLSALTNNFAELAFSQNGLASAPGMVLAHEIGHNLGCCHAVGDGGGCDTGLLFEYSNGYRYNGDSGTLWRTVMAYSPGQRIRHYSNPFVNFDGYPTGETGASDNADTLHASRFHVAGYRDNNGICEALDLPSAGVADCNENGVPDACDLALGNGIDDNGNGILDECECFTDSNGDGVIDDLDCLNDDCVDAIVVHEGATIFNNEFAATDGPLDNLCLGVSESASVDSDIWYRLVAPCSGMITVDLCGSSFDTKMAVYEGTCPSAANQAIACSEDSACAMQARISFDASQGQVYLVRVGGDTGPGVLSVSLPTCLPNDNCGTPLGISEGLTEFSTIGATTDGPPVGGGCETGALDQIDNDVWYRFTAPCDGDMTVSVCDSDFDTALAVYGTNCPSDGVVPLACDDDGCGLQSSVVFSAVAGDIYRIRVGGASGASGSGRISVTCGLVTPCPTDVNGDGLTDIIDLVEVILRWATSSGGADVDGDGSVGEGDLLAVAEGWGECQ